MFLNGEQYIEEVKNTFGRIRSFVMQKEKIISDTLLYSSANYVVIIVGFIVSVFSKKFLGVSGAGYWALLTVITTYGMYTSLGIKNALVREVPQCIGAKKIEEAKNLEDITFSFVVFLV